VIEKEETITQLHYKFEDLISSQVIEIPIYGGSSVPKGRKGGKNGKKQNRSKSQIR
jgi:hypothetical protein